MSAQHAIAMALARGKAGLDEFSDASVAHADSRKLASAVSFADDGSYGVESVTITLRLRDGSELKSHIDAARGSLAVPLTDADIEEKMHELCRWGGSGCDSRPLAEALWALDRRDDAGTLMLLAAGST